MQEKITYIKAADAFLLDRQVQKIREDVTNQAGYEPEQVSLDGSESGVDDLMYALDSGGLFSSARLVIWHSPSWLKNTGKRSPGREEDYLAVIEQFRLNEDQDCQLVITHLNESDRGKESGAKGKKEKAGKGEKGEPARRRLGAWLEQNARVMDLGPLQPAELKAWIRDLLAEKGQAADDNVLDQLARSGQAMYHLSTLIDKLCLFAGGRKLQIADLEDELEIKREISIFNFLDALTSRQAEPALRALDGLLDQGEAPMKILHMIAREMKILARIKSLQEQGSSLAEIEKQSGQKPFTVKKLTPKTRSFEWIELDRIFGLLLDTDVAFKNSSKPERVLLESLIVTFAQKT